MKNKFKEYYPLSDEEYKDLWDNALFVFDTNVILNLYRYSEPTKIEFIQALRDMQNRIWLPYKVGKEFHKNRLSVISDQKKIYSEYQKQIEKLNSEFRNKNRNPFLTDEVHKDLQEVLTKVQEELSSKEAFYFDLVSSDNIQMEIAEIFHAKIGNDFSTEKLNEIYKLGKQRYDKLVPPGFKDKKDKPEPDRYGDLVIWLQILEKAKSDKKNIILIIDDRKDDWWLEKSGKTISPLPELIREFYSDTGQLCYIYQPFQFLKYLNEYLGSKYNEVAINEIKDFKPSSNNNKVSEKRTIDIVVTIKDSPKDLLRFIELIKSAGYQTSYNELSEIDYQLIVNIPEIPDIERRFKDKYLSLLVNYNLELKDYKSISA